MSKAKPRSFLVAIVGGSGSGKSLLAGRLARRLGRQVTCVSLDDFYRDRSHLSLARRAQINYDHPRAIDWAAAERVLRDCLAGKRANVPCYDFETHRRKRETKLLQPGPIILVDGLWTLQRKVLRRLFGLRIYMDCPARTRLARRLARDGSARGRSPASVREQFSKSVEPMHRRFVEPQRVFADIVLRANWGMAELERVLGAIRERSKGRF